MSRVVRGGKKSWRADVPGLQKEVGTENHGSSQYMAVPLTCLILEDANWSR